MARVATQISAVFGSLLFVFIPLSGVAQSRAIPFDYVSNHLIVVRGSIGPVTAATLVVDTGTWRTVVDARTAAQLGSGRRPDVLEVFGRLSATERMVAPPLISFGSVRLESVEVLVTDLRPQEQRFGRRIDALLGMDVFLERCLTIGYAARQLAMECAGPLPRRARFTPPLPIVDVLIDGHPYRLIADTGSEIIAVFRTAMPANAPVKGDVRVSASHLHDTIELKRFAPRAVRVGNHPIGAPPVFIIENEQRIEGYDGVLGTRWLSDRQVRFDMRRGALSWAPAVR